MEVPDYYKDVSLRLMRVLHTAGLGEKERWKRINMWLQSEELWSRRWQNVCSVHVFGSQAEATTTTMLSSDLDVIFCENDITVLQDLRYWRDGVKTLLMITDDTTPPGYVKLQLVWGEQPIHLSSRQIKSITLDNYCRIVFFNTGPYFNRLFYDEHHGPANTKKSMFNFSTDTVFAIRGLSWPYTASEWITRHREHNWPSRDTVSIIQQSGAIFVPVGHKESVYKHLEFRISLSYGEKILVWQFSHTQYKCYVLLKMINKYFIKPKFGENALSSYHWKTCMFWMIETTPAALWHPQNLLLCIDLCLRKLFTWVEEGYFPNYFIPSENMFLGIVHGPIQSNLAYSLHDLFRQKGTFLKRIPYEGIGQELIRVCQLPITQIDDDNIYIISSLPFTVNMMTKNVLNSWFDILSQGVEKHPCILQRTFLSHGVRQEINTILRKFCFSSLGSHLASNCMEQDVIDQEGLDLAHEFLLLGLSSDVASGKLKLATFHLLQNNVVLAEYILHNIEESDTFLVSYVETEEPKYPIMVKIVNEDLSTTELIGCFYAFPVPYLPSEIHCTPGALIPEMFRSTGSYEGSLDTVLDYLQSWAVVDPKLYLHFLEHQMLSQAEQDPPEDGCFRQHDQGNST